MTGPARAGAHARCVRLQQKEDGGVLLVKAAHDRLSHGAGRGN